MSQGRSGIADRDLFHRIYDIDVSQGRLKAPEAMRPWIEQHFGSVASVLQQRVVRVTNLITLEEALFNQLRASRPVDWGVTGTEPSPQQVTDPFCRPLELTPEDTFGRVEGRHCITAGNVAKYDGFHGVIVFKEPDPLRFTLDQVVDYIDTALRWARKAHSADPGAKYFLFLWNCGWRAGASLRHGHAQVLLGRSGHYAKIEQLRCAALFYRDEYGSDYFADLFRVHKALGCGFSKGGVKMLAYLTPVKEKEVILIARTLNRPLKERIYEVLACFRDRMSVTSFNLAVFLPPLAPVEEEWGEFPAVARIVDRGSPASRASDIGAMELYASTVISSDPLEVARVLRTAVSGRTS